MKEKSILEQALLQVNTLEEAVKANAKGILASTMKQELTELLKESMENEEVTLPEEDEKDMSDDTTSDDDGGDDNTDDTNLDNEVPATDDVTDVTSDDMSDTETDDDFVPEEGTEEDEVLDMTGASHEEVLKVFKAMKPEDGVVVKKDGNTIEVNTGDDDFIIKLDSEIPDLPVDDELPSDDLDAELPVDDEFSDEEDSDDELPSDDLDAELPVDDEFSDEEDSDSEEEDDDELSDEEDSDSEEEDDDELSDEDDQLAEDSKPYGKGSSKKAGKNGPYSGTKKAGKNGPYTGSKKEVKEGDVKEGDESKPFGKGTKKAGKNGPFTSKAKEVKEDESEETIYEIDLDDADAIEGEQTEAARTKTNPHGNKGGGEGRAGLPSKTKWKAGSGVGINEEVEKLRKQNAEYKKALVLFKDKLNEVAIFTGGLRYATQLITEHSTTKQEKLNILKRFDSVSNMNEAKNLYNSIKTELETQKPVTESVVEKITLTPSTSSSSEVLAESKAYMNPQFARMKDLMKKIK